MKKDLFTVLWCLSVLFPIARAWGGEKPVTSRGGLRVMLVAPAKGEAMAREWMAFLGSRGMKVAFLPGERADVRSASPFDIIVLVGSGRRGALLKKVLELGKPVLGLGPYACKVFGAVKLKNGYPYT